MLRVNFSFRPGAVPAFLRRTGDLNTFRGSHPSPLQTNSSELLFPEVPPPCLAPASFLEVLQTCPPFPLPAFLDPSPHVYFLVSAFQGSLLLSDLRDPVRFRF